MAKRTGRAGTETSGSRIEGQIDAGSGSCRKRSGTPKNGSCGKRSRGKEERNGQAKGKASYKNKDK